MKPWNEAVDAIRCGKFGLDYQFSRAEAEAILDAIGYPRGSVRVLLTTNPTFDETWAATAARESVSTPVTQEFLDYAWEKAKDEQVGGC